MSRQKLYNFINWLAANAFISLGVSLTTKANFGMGMISAVPYELHVWLRNTYPWFTQGVAEYFVETFVLIMVFVIVREFHLYYLLSFLEAIVAGTCIDAWLSLWGGNAPFPLLGVRVLAFVCGMAVMCLGVAFIFRTNWPKQTYDLMVVEVIRKYHTPEARTKRINDICMLCLALILALGLNHSLQGIGIGTVIMTFANASIIHFFGKIIDKVEKRAVA